MFFGTSEKTNMKDTPEDHHDFAARFPHHYLQHHHQQRQPEQKRVCLSDEVDSSRSSGAAAEIIKKPRPTEHDNQEKAIVLSGGSRGGGGGGGDGATIEVAKRPRGRPPGSKNKPKPPVVITREAEPAAAMRPHVLEIPNGHDVVDSLARFSRRRNLGVCILAGTGAVTNVTLRQPTLGGAPHPPPAAGAAATIRFHGRFEILSMSATFFPPAMAALSPSASGTLSISLAGPQGQIVGGTVAGPLVASGPVVVVAAGFSNPTFHRLPVEDDVSVSVSVSGGGSGAEEQEQHVYQQQQQQERHRHRGHQGQATVAAAPVTAVESCGMSIYSGHLPSEVIWAPTARPPPPY